jgi:hypothetical protein
MAIYLAKVICLLQQKAAAEALNDDDDGDLMRTILNLIRRWKIWLFASMQRVKRQQLPDKLILILLKKNNERNSYCQ